MFVDLRMRGGGAALEIARSDSTTWQRRALFAAQCRFKMAAVCDRYCETLYKMSRFVMNKVVGRPEYLPGSSRHGLGSMEQAPDPRKVVSWACCEQ